MGSWLPLLIKGPTVRKVMGGGKKINAQKKAERKFSCRRKRPVAVLMFLLPDQ